MATALSAYEQERLQRIAENQARMTSVVSFCRMDDGTAAIDYLMAVRPLHACGDVQRRSERPAFICQLSLFYYTYQLNKRHHPFFVGLMRGYVADALGLMKQTSILGGMFKACKSTSNFNNKQKVRERDK
eukprot:3153216-Pyramimonas_sp.AAC.1